MENRRYYLVTPLTPSGTASSLTYHSDDLLTAGQLVRVPLARRSTLGIVTADTVKPTFATKAITQVLAVHPLPPDLLQLAHELAGYYAATPNSVFSSMLPAGLDTKRRSRDGAKTRDAAGLPTSTLTSDQQTALTQIDQAAGTPVLIQGVTGSGKTRVYLELAKRQIDKGQSVLVLVPEITLTPQIVAQFETVFGGIVLSSHSKLTPAARHHIWQQAVEATQDGQPRIVIGPRSVLFTPLFKLGLIIIDECHETSYKQEQQPRYHAIVAAGIRTRLNGAQLILGSATPGLTELALAEAGRFKKVTMTHRANNLEAPIAHVIDQRNKELFKSSKFIAQPLIDALTDTLKEARQSLLYLNRRGSASSQVCGNCGHIATCPNCQLPLTFHADLMRLVCHHCNYQTQTWAICPECKSTEIKYLGSGTKRIESEIERLFPNARIARLDRDSATIKHIEEVFRALKANEIDILIGTQMIAKGLDLPAVDTIGVVSADTMLHVPDFSAAERTFQLLHQVSGRAGRGDRPGQVFIQTYTPDHPAIQAAATGDFDSFAGPELSQRKALAYPPTVYLLKLTIASTTPETAQSSATAFVQALRRLPGLTVVGPAPAFIERQGTKYRWIVTVKSLRRPPLVDIAQNLPSKDWTADLDPINLL